MCDLNPHRTRQSSQLINSHFKSCFMPAGALRKKNTYTRQAHWGLNSATSCHIHKHPSHNTRKRYWLQLTGHKYTALKASTLSVCVQFSWLSSYVASSETCSAKHWLTWRQLQPLWCRVELYKRWKLSREQRSVICSRITAVAAATFWFDIQG